MMKPYDPKYDNITLWVYVILWTCLMFAATFPWLLTGEDGFDFILDLKQSITKWLFPMTMIIMIHLIETAYVMLTTPDIDKEQFRWGLVINFIIIVVLAGALIFSMTVPCLCLRIFFFVITWICLIAIKYMSIKLAKPQVVHIVSLQNKSNNENNK